MTITGNLLVRDAADHVVIERGATYHGRPCEHGHGTLRYVRNERCVECQREKSNRYREQRKTVVKVIDHSMSDSIEGTPEEIELLTGWLTDIAAFGDPGSAEGVRVGDHDVIGGTEGSLVELYEDRQARNRAARRASIAAAQAKLDAVRKRVGLSASRNAFQGTATQFEDELSRVRPKNVQRFRGSSLPKDRAVAPWEPSPRPGRKADPARTAALAAGRKVYRGADGKLRYTSNYCLVPGIRGLSGSKRPRSEVRHTD